VKITQRNLYHGELNECFNHLTHTNTTLAKMTKASLLSACAFYPSTQCSGAPKPAEYCTQRHSGRQRKILILTSKPPECSTRGSVGPPFTHTSLVRTRPNHCQST
jgi:hypothetical protein